MVERETIAYILLGLVFLRLLWIDIRPLVRELWPKDRRPFKVMATPHSEGYKLRSKNGNTEYFLTKYFIAIGNNLDKGTTLRRVQARLFFYGPPILCGIRDSELSEIDIRHGELAYFKIGQIATLDLQSIYHGIEEVDEKQMRVYEHNLPKGFVKFEVLNFNNKPAFSLNYTPEASEPWSFFVVLSADDVTSVAVHFKIDMTKMDKPVIIDSVK